MATGSTVEGLSARLDDLERTIAKAEAQQSYSTGLGLSVSRGNLAELYLERNRVRLRLARLQGQGFAVHGAIP